MPNVLILSKNGDGVPIALKLATEGCQVKLWIEDKDCRKSLSGYRNPSIVPNPNEGEYDLILSDMVGLGGKCEELKKSGRLVLGGGLFNDKLELDRDYGAKVVRSLCKIKEPNSTKITTTAELMDKVKNSIKPLVIKPLGNKKVDLTLVAKDDKNASLTSIITAYGKSLLPCIVQERIEGVEISTEGWFNGETFIKPFNHTIEKKRLMEMDKGPQTGCMGNIVWTTNGDRLTEEALMPLEPLLRKVNYIGPIDINCIVTASEAYFLEFTTRFGYDAIQAFTELLKINLYDFLYSVATKRGDLVRGTDYLDDIAIAVRLSLPPYPNEGAEKWRGVKVIELSDESNRHVWLADVAKHHGTPVVAGVDGVIGCVTAKGPNFREAQRRVYRTVNNIIINHDVQYRNDIGDGVLEKKQRFEAWCGRGK